MKLFDQYNEERCKSNIKSENIYSSYFIWILLDRKRLDFINFNYHERSTNERISCHSIDFDNP